MTSTFVVELTPPGRAAVAVVLVAGPEALRAVGECFSASSGRPLAESPVGRIALGRWGIAEGEELIVCRRSEDEIEIHCHGGTAAVGAVMRRLTELGCQPLSWQDWLRGPCGRVSPRLEFASRRDATMRAAQIALADAPTARTASVLLDQYYGALSRAIRSAIDSIESEKWTDASDLLGEMLRYRDVGLHLTRPWRVVLAGAPNVGKSSLINALAGYERAIVSPQPGTTRDVVTTSTAIAGWPVLLADTAGLRETADELELAGVALATSALHDADLVIAVEDVTDPRSASVFSNLPGGRSTISVRNKMDLLDTATRQATAGNAAIAVSAVTGEGLETLLDTIAQTLVPDDPPVGAAVPFTTEQVAGIDAAHRALQRNDADSGLAAMHALLTG